jgi:hypothetical protein
MESGYVGLTLAQIIFAAAVILVFIGFAIWGLKTHGRVRKLEAALRDFRELEPEGYEEEETLDTISEGARLRADSDAARERDIIEHRR